MSFEQPSNENGGEQTKSSERKVNKKKITSLALGALLSVSDVAGEANSAEQDTKEKNKSERIEKTTIESAALRPIVNEIMKNKLSADASKLEKNKKYRAAVVQIFMFVESQSNKEAAIKALEGVLQNADVRQDKELSQALRAAISKYPIANR
ncbi:MAG: hypothetical protein Q7R89_02015 [bacterium]|nr:hypothetical protein [bacterium]